MKKIKRTPPLPINEIGKMIKINGIVKPEYSYKSSDEDEDIFNLKGKTFRILRTTPKEPMYCYVLKHKVIYLGEYKKRQLRISWYR